MYFKGADESFSNVVAVDIRMDELEGAVPVFNDSTAVFSTGFVVKDLEVNAVAFGLEASRDFVVGDETVANFERLKCKDKDGVGVDVVGEHDISVSTLRLDREPIHVISVDLTDWLYTDMEFLRLGVSELTGDVQKRVNIDWLW